MNKPDFASPPEALAPRRLHRWGVGVGLASLVLIALAIRSIEIPVVFASEKTVYFAASDASYHARRALYTFENFPAILYFDPYLAHPDGAHVPIPPLFDWLLGAVARSLGSSQEVFETVAAWISPLLGSLAVLAVFGAGRHLGGIATGVLAGAVFAVLPLPAMYARVGNPDHHAAVAGLAALWLWLWLRLVASPPPEADAPRAIGRLLGRFLPHAGISAAMILTWSGSLLLVGVAEGTGLLVAYASAGRRDLVASQGWAALIAALLIVPFVLAGGAPVSGALSATTLSWLHPLVLLLLAVLCAGLAFAELRLPSRSVSDRLLRIVGLALLVGLLAFGSLPLREALLPAGEFVAGADVWARGTVEQQALFPFLRPGWAGPPRPPYYYYGVLTFVLPLVPLGLIPLLRDPRRRSVALVTLGWLLPLGFLAITQIRFGNEFSVPASVAFAAIAREALPYSARIPDSRRTAIAALLLLLLLAPGAVPYHATRANRARNLARSYQDPTRISTSQDLKLKIEFFEEVRARTPETRGWLEPDARPDYGLLVPPGLGHLAVYRSRRPTPAGNLGPYLDAKKYADAEAFYRASSEREALEIAERLAVRYVVVPRSTAGSGDVQRQLARYYGSAFRHPEHIAHFRLVTERGQGYRLKLFEIVAGALITARAQPGAELVATLGLVLPEGVTIRYRAVGVAGEDGVVQLRVPYATGRSGGLRTLGPYRITLEGRRYELPVAEADVLEGRTVPLTVDH